MADLGTIIFVPGTGASELIRPAQLSGVVPRATVWLDYPLIAAGGWRFMGLLPDGITPPPPFGPPLLPGFPVMEYCGVGIRELSSYGWSVFRPQLDWRGTIAADGARLADFVRRAASYQPIHIVGHSRGGLVVRYAIEQLRQSGSLGIVGKVVGLGVPHNGTWAAAGLLAGWDTFVEVLRAFLALSTPAGIAPIIGNDLQVCINSWPSAYLLLPNPAAPQLTANDQAVCNDNAAWAGISPAVSTAWLDAYRAAWASMPAYPSDVLWLDVVGRGFVTSDHCNQPTAPSSSTGMTNTVLGDGTVLSRWAVGPYPPYLYAPTSHRSLISDGRILTDVSLWLQGRPLQSYVIQGTPLD